MRLLFYRLRPVSWSVLVVASSLWLLTIDLAGPRLGPVDLVYATRAAGVLVGIQAAFLVSSEVDPPLPILQGAPVPYWHTATSRLVLWVVVMAGVLVLVVSHIGAGQVGHELSFEARLRFATGASELAESAVAAFVLATGLAYLLATVLGSLLGAAIGLGVLAVAGAVFFGQSGSPLAGTPDVLAYLWWELGIGVGTGLAAVVAVRSGISEGLRFNLPKRRAPRTS
ncbi:MAG: hypothetical protein ACLPSM_04410 [Acidimicrobiales bacterium]